MHTRPQVDQSDPVPPKLRRKYERRKHLAFWCVLLIVVSGAVLNARYGCAGTTCKGLWCEVQP